MRRSATLLTPPPSPLPTRPQVLLTVINACLSVTTTVLQEVPQWKTQGRLTTLTEGRVGGIAVMTVGWHSAGRVPWRVTQLVTCTPQRWTIPSGVTELPTQTQKGQTIALKVPLTYRDKYSIIGMRVMLLPTHIVEIQNALRTPKFHLRKAVFVMLEDLNVESVERGLHGRALA